MENEEKSEDNPEIGLENNSQESADSQEKQQDQQSIQETLNSLVGKIIATSVKDQFVGFGILQTDGTHYGWGNFGFLPGQIERINLIEASEDVNVARANIVLKNPNEN